MFVFVDVWGRFCLFLGICFPIGVVVEVFWCACKLSYPLLHYSLSLNSGISGVMGIL